MTEPENHEDLMYTTQHMAEIENIEDPIHAIEMEEVIKILRNNDLEFSTTNGPGKESYLVLSSISKTFTNREELIESIREIALAQGYAVSIKRSKKDRYVIIGCDRGGKYRSHVPAEKIKKLSSSRLINCPFEIWGKKKADGLWKVETKNLQHNHEQSKDMSGHPSCRRFSEEELQRIKELSKAGIPPRQILIALRKSNPNLLAISRTLYNAKAKIRRDSLNGRTIIQALFDEFGKSGFSFDVQRDKDGYLTHLFFVHPYSITLMKSYSTVFVMDCTYKTNKYKMPLLEIVGVTSFNTSFYSCFVAMEKEEENDYIWALERFRKILGVGNYPSVIVTDRELALMNAIQVVFPDTINLLCVWHIEKNILSKCKQYFEEKKEWDAFQLAWTNLIESLDVLTFEEKWQYLEAEYKGKPLVLDYLKNTWLPFKDKFVYAWTQKCLHFGHHSSSRAEGAHAMLKRYLQVSTGDFCEVKDKICTAIENQYQEVKARFESEKLRIPIKFGIPLFQKVRGKVSLYALKELFQQYELVASSGMLDECRGHFMSSMGLPCSHMIREKMNGMLELHDIHPQWRIDCRSFDNISGDLENRDDRLSSIVGEFQEKYQMMPLSEKEVTLEKMSQLTNVCLPVTHEPRISSHRGRPTGSNKRKNDNSTRRNFSAFEIVEKGRKCGGCGCIGHNIRSCSIKK